MGRPKGKGNVSEKVKNKVKELLFFDESLTGKGLQNAVEKQITDERYSERTYQYVKEEVLPGVHAEKSKNLDVLWHIGLLSQDDLRTKYPELTAEAIEVITDAQKWAEKERIEFVVEKGLYPTRHGITLRQALWIARLHKVVRKYMGNYIREIWRVAYVYSAYELKCKLSSTEFDTWEFDRALRKASKMHGNEQFVLLIWNELGRDDDPYGFQAEYQLHMASQPIKVRKLKSIKEIAEEAGQSATRRQDEIVKQLMNDQEESEK